ncbi:MAG: GntG family PLP-dependent aldolase [Acidobacteriota bacterium]|nr:GntG family PLP-dependent aldolase [Acidobacteriota bacterium]
MYQNANRTAPVVADLRSDTVTRPTPEMRRAMADAEVGDDAFGEDPTVRRLEEQSAELLGQEAAVFVPSGTMGNQIALNLLGAPGGEVVCAEQSHIIDWEMGAVAVISGMIPRTVVAPEGQLDPSAVSAAIRPRGALLAPTLVLSVENTANMAGGRVYRRERLDQLLALAAEHRLGTHLDGARLFNAAVALGQTPAHLAAGFDVVMVCLSKGLGAPVGSLVAGSQELMTEARRRRKMLGGTMRQAGIVAAAGLVALETGIERLEEDHENARFLARELTQLPGLEVDAETVETNILMVAVAAEGEDAPALRDELRRRGVLCEAVDRCRLRLVTHRDVDRQALEAAVAVFQELRRAAVSR